MDKKISKSTGDPLAIRNAAIASAMQEYRVKNPKVPANRTGQGK